MVDLQKPPPPPKQPPFCTWLPTRTTKGKYAYHQSLGHAKNAMRAQGKYASNFQERKADPSIPYRHWTYWPDGAIWEWKDGDWVLLYQTVDGQTTDPW